MNPHDTDATPDALRWQLRALRQPLEPGRDLWPGIAAQLAPRRRPQAARAWRGWALAATVALALGVAALWRAPQDPAREDAIATAVMQREAQALTQQYEAALRELPPPDALAPSVRTAFDDLDRDAALIRQALRRDPDSRLLLQQLRRTYTQRLALTQRLAHA